MSNRIDIPLPNGCHLVAEQNIDAAYPYEMFIGIVDNGVWLQDLAVVRNAYKYEEGKVVWKDGEFNVIVYSDKDDENYTHYFTIGLYDGGA